ncbi:conserved protein of unknown function [Cupriavidus taiwanensis]|uniref:Uncharacterized protein n=1 Tax=Cupriavidus taiwanensis TaxID=164546 RepID=A0A375II14_9BURK|nr:hypothetical protein [Cupriavidus taiwanensis]SPK73720.1 conserved protein of unknown function [Cupriavidus taiwanensis]
MSNSTTLLDTISANQASKEVVVNALFDAASPAMLWGRRASTCNGLTWGYYGGNYQTGSTAHAIANGTVTLTASTTNYVYADASTGAVSVNTSGFPAGSIPLYSIVTGSTTVSSYTDVRSYQPSAVASAAGSVYDVGGYISGTPADGEVVWKFYSPRAWTLPAGAPGGAKSGAAATGSSAFTFAKNGTSIGTLSWSAAGTVATLSITSSTSIAAGDLLTLTAPTPADATLADIAFTLAGTRP